MKSQKSFTLIELLVAVMIFSLIGGIAAGVFTTGLRAQRKSLASQEILSQTSYLMEYISRALRMARKDINGACIDPKLNYKIVDNGIEFLNYKGECQRFYLDGTQLKERKRNIASGVISVSELTSTDLQVNHFNIGPDDSWDQNDNDQPRVTFFLEIRSKEQSKIKIQTTVSQRNPDIEK